MKVKVQPVSMQPTSSLQTSEENLKSQRGGSENDSKKARVCEALNNFSARTSLNGLVFIQTSSDIKMKLFWSLVFLSAVGALVFHSYSTVADYLEYRTQTSSELIFEKTLNLPAVTICNHNPVRLSKVDLLTEYLQDIIENARSGGLVNFTEYDSENGTSETDPQMMLRNAFYQQLAFFLSDISIKNRDSIQMAGHQLEDMILWCTIAGETCGDIAKELLHSEEYNNCYTLDTSSLEQLGRGTYEGLELALYLEPDEYIPGLMDTKGIQLQIHTEKSLVYPSYDGMAISPGKMAFVAIAKERNTRLGQPYSECMDVDDQDYIDKYNFRYGYKMCKEICWIQQYATVCGCYYKTWLNILYNPNNVSNCEGYDCKKIYEVYDLESCNCQIPCRETVYTSKVSLAQWPNFSQAKLLVEYLCKKTDFPPERCEQLRNQNEMELRNNFVGIRIFYDTMITTNITDLAEINLATFLSNLGGCVGLWIGVSVFSIVELLHLFADIIWSVLSRKKQSKNVNEESR